MLDSIFMILPRSLHAIISRLPKNIQSALEEIRVREQRPLEIIYCGQFAFVSEFGSISEFSHSAYIPNHEDCMQLLDLLANHSLYTLEEELKRGYITVRGGHRIGLAGRTVLEQGRVQQIREISSFNIRIAREVKGAGQHILPYLFERSTKQVHHTLIISPPQQGKTTLARDLARVISYGGLKVGIIDERSELAGCHKGIPTFDVGPRTDVMDSCPKAEGMMMMIRSMSPDVIVVDEIGRDEDAEAIHEALHAGIKVIATAHGQNLDDVSSRPILKRLMSEVIFSRYVVLSRTHGRGSEESVYDGSGIRLSKAGVIKVRHEHV